MSHKHLLCVHKKINAKLQINGGRQHKNPYWVECQLDQIFSRKFHYFVLIIDVKCKFEQKQENKILDIAKSKHSHTFVCGLVDPIFVLIHFIL